MCIALGITLGQYPTTSAQQLCVSMGLSCMGVKGMEGRDTKEVLADEQFIKSWTPGTPQ